MKFSISKSDLENVVSSILPCISSKPTSPIFGALLIEAEGSHISVRGQNQSIDVTVKIKADVESPGQVAVDAAIFVNLIRGLPDEQLEIRRTDTRLYVKSGTGSRWFAIFDESDFPMAPLSLSNGVHMDARILGDIIDNTVFACADDFSRPILTGLHFDWPSGLVVGSDGVIMTVQFIEERDFPPVTIPSNTISLSKRFFGSSTVNIEVTTGLTHIFSDNASVFLNHLADPYPAQAGILLETFLHTEYAQEFLCPRDDVKRIASTAVFLSESARATGADRSLHLQLSDNSLVFSMSVPDVGKIEETLEVEGRGEIHYTISPDLLQKASSAAPGDILKFSLKSPTSPLLLQCPQFDGWYSILVPMLGVDGVAQYEEERRGWTSGEENATSDF